MYASHAGLQHDYEVSCAELDFLVAEAKKSAAVWAVWPFETMIIPKRHIQHIGRMSEAEKDAFSLALSKLTAAYDKVFGISFPYSAGIHQSPTDNQENTAWHLHMHFYPPLLRSASVKKFMVGYEMLGDPQRDITPETSAQMLRKLF